MGATIDLNADLGEFDSSEGMARDRAIMPFISSCNIACGGHAGTDDTMRATLRAAASASVAPGAHPSYPDREGFGRKSLNMAPDVLTQSLHQQVANLSAVADKEGIKLQHLKPHGALYNDMQDDAVLAGLVAQVAEYFGLPLVGMPSSEAQRSAKGAYLAEAFVDRRYTDQGRLQPRAEDGAVIEDIDEQVVQALAIARGEPIRTASGGSLTIRADTLCLHGDSKTALETARGVREALEAADISVARSE